MFNFRSAGSSSASHVRVTQLYIPWYVVGAGRPISLHRPWMYTTSHARKLELSMLLAQAAHERRQGRVPDDGQRGGLGVGLDARLRRALVSVGPRRRAIPAGPTAPIGRGDDDARVVHRQRRHGDGRRERRAGGIATPTSARDTRAMGARRRSGASRRDQRGHGECDGQQLLTRLKKTK